MFKGNTPSPKKALKEWHGIPICCKLERFIKVYSIILNTSVLRRVV